jgi:hypothetical protein
MNQPGTTNNQPLPACLGAEEAARFFGWPAYFLPVLAKYGHLKPLGKPAQNSRKWYARQELEKLSGDTAWLDKAVRLMEKHVREANLKQRGTLLVEPVAAGVESPR